MGTHHHIHISLLQSFKNRAPLRRRAEAVEQGHLERIGGEALTEGAPVLLGQHRGGRQQRTLLAGGHRLEDRPNRHLGLAEADIATDQPVHRLGALHIAFHFDDRLALIRRGFVGEGILQFALPGAIGGEGEAGRLVALRIELDQIHRHPADGLLGPLLGFGPGRAAHAVQLRGLVAGGAVTAQAAQLIRRHPQQAIGVLHHQVVAGFATNR